MLVVSEPAADRAASELHSRGRRAEPRTHEQLLADVVASYRKHIDDPAPRKMVARELGYTVGYIAQLLHEARQGDEPLLGPASKGRAGETGGR